jgi:phosphoserine phosphatase
MNIYIIRHGETEMNKHGIIQGRSINSDLNEVGHRQAKAFYAVYNDISFDVILTSSLKRTHQTVQQFIDDKKAVWIKTPELDEIGWGVHEGQQIGNKENQKSFNDLMLAWDNEEYHAAIPNGESIASLAGRLSSMLSSLKSSNAKNVLLCTHGRTLLCLIAILKNQPLRNMKNFRHGNTCLYQVNYSAESGFVFERENDNYHLETFGLK